MSCAPLRSAEYPRNNTEIRGKFKQFELKIDRK
jgi:hypothetical protein